MRAILDPAFKSLALPTVIKQEQDLKPISMHGSDNNSNNTIVKPFGWLELVNICIQKWPILHHHTNGFKPAKHLPSFLSTYSEYT